MQGSVPDLLQHKHPLAVGSLGVSGWTEGLLNGKPVSGCLPHSSSGLALEQAKSGLVKAPGVGVAGGTPSWALSGVNYGRR